MAYQVCIQVASTVGCKAFGIEIIPQRHETGLALLVAFDAILKEVFHIFEVVFVVCDFISSVCW